MRVLRSSRPIVEMSIPSILKKWINYGSSVHAEQPHKMLPPEGSTILRSDMAKVDLPNKRNYDHPTPTELEVFAYLTLSVPPKKKSS